jgi:hypothetical protein
MNPQSDKTIPINKSARCQHRTPAGRQCRLLASNTHSGLCAQHHAEYRHRSSADLSASLTKRSGSYETAQGINSLLVTLYGLLAENRISPRRAAVLAYISSLLLRTLPAIDADQAAGITGADSGAGSGKEVPLPALPEDAMSS